MEYASIIFSSLLPQIPTIILHAVGLWLSITRRAQHPRASLAAAIYFGLALLLRVLSLVYVVLPTYMQETGGTVSNLGQIYTTLNVICIPVYIVMDIALLYAIFAPRNQPADPNAPIFIGGKDA